ncbi:hypothetical protein RchiOBHm_Chr2g0102401 [Rosa chinensis]|uniref:Uncharacterized protein n=1 Tax=Rosa chinensis TaxID=74649 RepID=A0A2P6RMP0_ROSCH|nr:hypothetical protein RchiOBHm_Chr2g0102401 [Rosa chinensis]
MSPVSELRLQAPTFQAPLATAELKVGESVQQSSNPSPPFLLSEFCLQVNGLMV